MQGKKIILVFVCIVFSLVAIAQKGMIAGVVIGENKATLNGATIRLTKQGDSLYKKVEQSNEKGLFTFANLPKGKYNITISYVGYMAQPFVGITVNDSLANIGKVAMQRKPQQDGAVTVVGKATVTQKADTIVYNAAMFKTNPDATVEDLVRKMPGITIENGVVKAQGEDVKKVTIDGKDFFGDDATAALRNLPADIVDKIQVFDRQSDQAAFTGFDDGNSQKALNIVTKSGLKNGQFGRLYAGAGTKDTYSAGGNVTFFKGNRRIAIIGQANNINQQNFSFQDILGLTGNSMGGGGRGGMGGMQMGGGRGGAGGGGGRGGTGGGMGGAGGFFVGQQSGINATKAIGFNINDQWGKKATVSGSYFFNNNNNNQDQFSNIVTIKNPDTSLYNVENALNNSTNFNNRINMRLEYKIDSANSIIVSPSLSFQNNESTSNTETDVTINNTGKKSAQKASNNRDTKGYNYGGTILYRHAFKKKGRTISFNINTNINNRDGATFTLNKNVNYRLPFNISDSLNQLTDIVTKGYSVGGSINFTEPIGKQGQLQISYSPNYNNNRSNQIANKYDYFNNEYIIFNPNLSNKFDNVYVTNNGNISYRKGNRDNSFTIGLSAQHSNLKSEQVYPQTLRIERTFFNVLPEARWERKINTKNSVRVNYRTNTNAPSISQLQNVYNVSNLSNISTGNPDLKQSFSHNLNGRYTFTNGAKSKSFFYNIMLQTTSNYISNASFIAVKDSVLNPSVKLYTGSQLTKPVNTNGFFSIRNFITYGKMVTAIKTNVNTSLGYSFTNIPGIVSGQKNNSKTNTFTANINLSSNISQYIDYNANFGINRNLVQNSVQSNSNQNYTTYNSGLQINLLSKKGWFLQNDINNQTYGGLSTGLNQSFWLWNASVGKKFLKEQKGELKLSVFDLLKQNQSIQRNITAQGYEDIKNVVLTQYVMLTFTYKLKNFGSANQYNQNNNNTNRQEEFRDRMRMGGGGF